MCLIMGTTFHGASQLYKIPFLILITSIALNFLYIIPKLEYHPDYQGFLF